ncbi:MAG TPA: GNAT family N-acetyltransferase [Anaerolineales bacterium]|nr:GNAT family N-acetyltransferase [Anaerolineales bacterium]
MGTSKQEPRLETLETERLTLRPLTDEDAGFILELLNDPSFIRNIGDRKVRTLQDARTYITDGPVASYARNGFGLYLVELTESGAAMGMCGLIRRNTLNDVDIGYAFLPMYWSKGYAFEAALAMKQHARDVLGLRRMVAIVDPQNLSSIRLLEKLGMKFERMVKLSEDDIDLELFSIDL